MSTPEQIEEAIQFKKFQKVNTGDWIREAKALTIQLDEEENEAG